MLCAKLDQHSFVITVEVVPPASHRARPTLDALSALAELPIDAFSVATNPVAKPRMSADVLAILIQETTGREAILHCTTRDHNRLSLQGLLWGARAAGIETVLVSTGDFVALGDRATVSTVGDLGVLGLARMAREAGLCVGVVFDARTGLAAAGRHLCDKADAGAQFVVTQPVYDRGDAEAMLEAIAPCGLPVIMGILPLRTARHAHFLHDEVAGITVPLRLREAMDAAADPLAVGAANAREMLALARERFAGACVMPPFGHYEVLFDILRG